MKSRILTAIAFAIALSGCEDEESLKQEFVFVEDYCTMVTVGGVVGVMEKCFSVGDVVIGHRTFKGTVSIGIAGPSRSDAPVPGSATFQEMLEIPAEYVRLK